MKKEYGEALYSVTVDLDLGCPNRDIDGNGGCSFCPEHGARSAQSMDAKSVEEQIKVGIAFAKKRYKAKRFMLYIQAYTGTFSTLQEQKETYAKLLKLYNFDAISIGTRPDCLDKKTLEYLKELNKNIVVYIDLGVQSLNDKTLKHINRGHNAKQSLEAIKNIKEYGLKIYAHIIVGLPNESRKDWEYTVKKMVSCKVDGIKLHNLHVIKNTALADEYKKTNFKVYDEYEYAEELMHLIRLIPINIPILRIATDTPNKDLIAPFWSMQKGQFGDFIHNSLEYRFGESKVDNKFWSEKYKDYYYPRSGAVLQAKELFIKHSDLEKRLTCKDIKLLDIGFGFGTNTLESLHVESKNSLHVTALDQDKSILKIPKNRLLNALYSEGIYRENSSSVKFIVGDVRHTLKGLNEQFDIIFFDPFREDKNSSMVNLEVFKNIKRVLKKDGVLVTSTHLNSTKELFEKVGLKTKIISVGDIRGIISL